MDALSTLRLRLEGRLEHLEHATTLFERAAGALARESAEDLTPALTVLNATATLDAEAAATRLSRDEPALQPVLARLELARSSFVDGVFVRAALRGYEARRLETALEIIQSEPLLFRGRLSEHTSPLLRLFLGELGGTDVCVTPVRFTIGREVFLLARLRLVSFRKFFLQKNVLVRLVPYLGDVVERQVPEVPRSLRRALREAGVKVEVSWG